MRLRSFELIDRAALAFLVNLRWQGLRAALSIRDIALDCTAPKLYPWGG